ncbi:dehydrase and lipid transport-domain-containing protein [Chaetomium strumarium]|uniref:Dehydrase and lipid transport-domain-containing protein n=1 Tax=Chaetomium strumarium TaxID=1170767 RepID=A0AAJ0M4N0_9PEZI|nr:dehydrase and lipid transport-domain-containing protein [Chaetomium strumarium]
MAPNIPGTMRRAGPRLLATRAPLWRIPTPPPSALPLCASSPAQPPNSFLPQLDHIRRAITTTTPRRSLGPASWLLSALPNFSPNPSPPQPQPPPPKTLRARRLLPYPPAQIYTLIADIDSYADFLPHCTHSRVTRWTTTSSSSSASKPSPPPETPAGQRAVVGERYPALADLTVGWGPFTQTYTSRVYCVPGEVVEAVSGRAETSISPEVLRRVGYETILQEDGREKLEGGIFESLITRWAVKPATGPGGGKEGREEWTEVMLSVTFQFANPALGFAVGQLADDKVDEMVEAFEGRARKLYGR